MSEHVTLSERFLSKAPQNETPSGCLEWTGKPDRNGYGRLGFDGRELYAHRTAFELYSQVKIPRGMQIRHKCDNRRCVNPAHLELGTKQDNMTDMMSRQRQSKGETHNTAKLKEGDVLRVRRLLEEGIAQRVIAEEYGVSPSLISLISQGKIWRHL